MVRFLGRFPSRFLGLLAALLWAWSVHTAQLHPLTAVHAVCAEHGHLVDVPEDRGHASAQADRTAGPSVWAATTVQDHGCTVQVLVPLEPPPLIVVQQVGRLSFSVVDPLAAHEAPRGPPLAYAPKTSPPALV